MTFVTHDTRDTPCFKKNRKKVASTFENRNGAVVSLQHENHKKVLAARKKA
jgi:hypothetical protein